MASIDDGEPTVPPPAGPVYWLLAALVFPALQAGLGAFVLASDDDNVRTLVGGIVELALIGGELAVLRRLPETAALDANVRSERAGRGLVVTLGVTALVFAVYVVVALSAFAHSCSTHDCF